MLKKHVAWLRHHFPNLNIIQSDDNPMNEWFVFKDDSPIHVGVISRRDGSNFWDLHIMGVNIIVTLFLDSGEIASMANRWDILKEWNDANK